MFQYHLYAQWQVGRQLESLTAHAERRELLWYLDFPLGVSGKGFDVWRNQQLFVGKAAGGAPPDSFFTQGQNWGFPTYNWDIMAKDGYAWWKERFANMSRYFDAYRIDHILGFFRIWTIPREQTQGLMGYFEPALPFTSEEIRQRGIPFDYDRMARPYITDDILEKVFSDGRGTDATAPALAALGLELVAFRRRPEPGADVPQVGPAGLKDALAAADVVVCTLPLTPGTEGLIGAEELAAMKPTAILVNVGRGGVIAEEPLYRALAEGRLFGAGLDVWYVYPGSDEERRSTLPSRFPFHELDNVVMTPHSANDVRGWREAAVRDVFATLAAIARGEERNLVDPAQGY